jgi:hypothetical protein
LPPLLDLSLSLSLSLSLWLYSPLLGPGLFFSLVMFFYTDGRTPWTEDQPVTRPLHTHRTRQTQNECTQISAPRVGFEPTIPVFERSETVHALDSVTTVIGSYSNVETSNSPSSRQIHIQVSVQKSDIPLISLSAPENSTDRGFLRHYE